METMSGKIRDMLGQEAPVPVANNIHKIHNDNNNEMAPTHKDPDPPTLFTKSENTEDKMETDQLVTEPTPPSTIDHDGAMDFD